VHRDLDIRSGKLATGVSIEPPENHKWPCRLTLRWSGRVIDKVPSPNVGVRAAQLNR